MDLQKSKDLAERVAPMLEKIEETDAVAAKMIDVFTNALKLGGQLERSRMASEDESQKKGGASQ